MNRRDISKFGKFTRGEKCIFFHLVLTFVLILVSIFVYFVHLCLVNHIGNSVFNTRRVSQLYPKNKEGLIPDYLPVGILTLNITPPRVICSTIHLRERWSIAPAHCVIIRTDPDLVELLPKWRIKYTTIDFQEIATEIKRSIAHPHFNRDDFSNNIGLLEHIISVPIPQYPSLPRPKNSLMEFGDDNMQLVQWTPSTTENKGPLARSNRFRLHFVNIMDRPKCINYMAPVVDLRSYEFCVTLKDRINVNFDHGAALLQGYNITGFFSWGERQGKTLPFIIVYIPKFKDWLEDIVSIQNILL